jgi:hypothetical protein
MVNTIHNSIRNGTGRGQEGVPPPASPERPPLAPHDPPDPAPQAAAWQRALRVVFMESTRHGGGAPHSGRASQGSSLSGQGSSLVGKGRAWRVNKRGRAAIKSRH